jgi:nucleoid-associated protein YgaU
VDKRLLAGIVVATVVAVAAVFGVRAYLTPGAPDPAAAPSADGGSSGRTQDAGAPAGAGDPGAGRTETGNAALDDAMGAARDTLATLSPDPAPAPESPVVAPGTGPEPPPEPRIRASGAPEDPDAPTFDVVRVEPDGSAVMAGRAAPGATVSILDAGAAIGQATADDRGQWVFVPDAPLDPGDRELSLSATGGRTPAPDTADVVADAGTVRLSPTVVVLSVPEPPHGPDAQADLAPVIALEAPRAGGGAGRLLQGPTAEATRGTLQVGRVDYSSSGALSLSGTARPGAVVQLYMDNAPVARVEADAAGIWTATPDTDRLEEKLYTLRVDQVGTDGGVDQRVELPFQHTDFTFRRGEAGETLLVVQPGNNLWRVARAVYGEGTDYTVIYQANADQIRDPDLIYPGQVFVVPGNGRRTAED